MYEKTLLNYYVFGSLCRLRSAQAPTRITFPLKMSCLFESLYTVKEADLYEKLLTRSESKNLLY